MTNHTTQIIAITKLAIEITDLGGGHNIHACPCGSSAISVTVFGAGNELLWQSNLYEWDSQGAYEADLRLLRHRLEEMLNEALEKGQGVAA